VMNLVVLGLNLLFHMNLCVFAGLRSERTFSITNESHLAIRGIGVKRALSASICYGNWLWMICRKNSGLGLSHEQSVYYVSAAQEETGRN
jgi:hypothetical protein